MRDGGVCGMSVASEDRDFLDLSELLSGVESMPLTVAVGEKSDFLFGNSSFGA